MHESVEVELRRVLRHPQPAQLMYQLREIVDEKVYLQHGVSLAPGDVVFDVGANVGVAAAFFAAECGAVVHSFEPVTPIFEILCENLRSFPMCTAHNVGLSSASRSSSITYYPNADAMSGLYADASADRELTRACMRNLGMSAEDAARALAGRFDEPVTLTCELRTLSDIIGEWPVERIQLLKVDVEHAELDVLLGIDEHHWARIDQIVIEVHDIGDRLTSVISLLRQHGYDIDLAEEPAMRSTGLYLVYATRSDASDPHAVIL